MPKGNPGQPKREHTGEFKQKVVEYMRAEKLSYREAARQYNVSSAVVMHWERKYLQEGAASLYKESRGRASREDGVLKGKPKKLSQEVENDLIAENQRLRMEVDYLKKLNALVQETQVLDKKRK